ncbi:MAG: hypothetical protein ACYC7E_22405 [Armatimonadota bacterium]
MTVCMMNSKPPTCFVGVNPIILFPLPIEKKLGMNGPMGGFLEENYVEILYKLLKPESLSRLLEYYESNPVVVSIREYFEGLPDITEEELIRQIEEYADRQVAREEGIKLTDTAKQYPMIRG